METEQLTFGDRLREAIAFRGLTNKGAIEVLTAAGVPSVSHGNFYKILGDEQDPRVSFLDGFCRELGVSARYLLTGEGPIEQQWSGLDPEQEEEYGLRDLPEGIQVDIVRLAEQLLAASERTGLNLDDVSLRTRALTKGIAAWLRLPMIHSNKLHSPESDLEASAFCGQALRALRLLIPRPGERPTAGAEDEALLALARAEESI